MPARYWSEVLPLPDGAKAELFFTDTSPFLERYWGSDKVKVDGQDWRAQLAWLEARLSASTADWKLVFGHHPLFTDSKADAAEGGRDVSELITHFKPLLDRHGVQAYFNGHDHNQQHLTVDRVSYICSGAGSQTGPVAPTARCRFASDHPGFVMARLSAGAAGAGVHRPPGARPRPRPRWAGAHRSRCRSDLRLRARSSVRSDGRRPWGCRRLR